MTDVVSAEAQEVIDAIVALAKVRKVASAEGVEKYDAPIGTPIVPHPYVKKGTQFGQGGAAPSATSGSKAAGASAAQAAPGATKGGTSGTAKVGGAGATAGEWHDVSIGKGSWKVPAGTKLYALKSDAAEGNPDNRVAVFPNGEVHYLTEDGHAQLKSATASTVGGWIDQGEATYEGDSKASFSKKAPIHSLKPGSKMQLPGQTATHAEVTDIGPADPDQLADGLNPNDYVKVKTKHSATGTESEHHYKADLEVGVQGDHPEPGDDGNWHPDALPLVPKGEPEKPQTKVGTQIKNVAQANAAPPGTVVKGPYGEYTKDADGNWSHPTYGAQGANGFDWDVDKWKVVQVGQEPEADKPKSDLPQPESAEDFEALQPGSVFKESSGAVWTKNAEGKWEGPGSSLLDSDTFFSLNPEGEVTKVADAAPEAPEPPKTGDKLTHPDQFKAMPTGSQVEYTPPGKGGEPTLWTKNADDTWSSPKTSYAVSSGMLGVSGGDWEVKAPSVPELHAGDKLEGDHQQLDDMPIGTVIDFHDAKSPSDDHQYVKGEHGWSVPGQGMQIESVHFQGAISGGFLSVASLPGDDEQNLQHKLAPETLSPAEQAKADKPKYYPTDFTDVPEGSTYTDPDGNSWTKDSGGWWHKEGTDDSNDVLGAGLFNLHGNKGGKLTPAKVSEPEPVKDAGVSPAHTPTIEFGGVHVTQAQLQEALDTLAEAKGMFINKPLNKIDNPLGKSNYQDIVAEYKKTHPDFAPQGKYAAKEAFLEALKDQLDAINNGTPDQADETVAPEVGDGLHEFGGVKVTPEQMAEAYQILSEAKGMQIKQPLAKVDNPLAGTDYHGVIAEHKAATSFKAEGKYAAKEAFVAALNKKLTDLGYWESINPPNAQDEQAKVDMADEPDPVKPKQFNWGGVDYVAHVKPGADIHYLQEHNTYAVVENGKVTGVFDAAASGYDTWTVKHFSTGEDLLAVSQAKVDAGKTQLASGHSVTEPHGLNPGSYTKLGAMGSNHKLIINADGTGYLADQFGPLSTNFHDAKWVQEQLDSGQWNYTQGSDKEVFDAPSAPTDADISKVSKQAETLPPGTYYTTTGELYATVDADGGIAIHATKQHFTGEKAEALKKALAGSLHDANGNSVHVPQGKDTAYLYGELSNVEKLKKLQAKLHAGDLDYITKQDVEEGELNGWELGLNINPHAFGNAIPDGQSWQQHTKLQLAKMFGAPDNQDHIPSPVNVLDEPMEEWEKELLTPTKIEQAFDVSPGTKVGTMEHFKALPEGAVIHFKGSAVDTATYINKGGGNWQNEDTGTLYKESDFAHGVASGIVHIEDLGQPGTKNSEPNTEVKDWGGIPLQPGDQVWGNAAMVPTPAPGSYNNVVGVVHPDGSASSYTYDHQQKKWVAGAQFEAGNHSWQKTITDAGNPGNQDLTGLAKIDSNPALKPNDAPGEPKTEMQTYHGVPLQPGDKVVKQKSGAFMSGLFVVHSDNSVDYYTSDGAGGFVKKQSAVSDTLASNVKGTGPSADNFEQVHAYDDAPINSEGLTEYMGQALQPGDSVYHNPAKGWHAIEHSDGTVSVYYAHGGSLKQWSPKGAATADFAPDTFAGFKNGKDDFLVGTHNGAKPTGGTTSANNPIPAKAGPAPSEPAVQYVKPLYSSVSEIQAIATASMKKSSANQMARKLAEDAGYKNVAAQYTSKMSHYQVNQWIKAWTDGDLAKAYEIEKSVAPGGVLKNEHKHPGNKPNAKVQWGPAVPGEVPAGVHVNDPSGTIGASSYWGSIPDDAADAYMVAAQMEHSTGLSSAQKKLWTTYHAAGNKLETDKLSLQAMKNVADGKKFSEPITPPPQVYGAGEQVPVPGDWDMTSFGANLTPEQQDQYLSAILHGPALQSMKDAPASSKAQFIAAHAKTIDQPSIGTPKELTEYDDLTDTPNGGKVKVAGHKSNGAWSYTFEKVNSADWKIVATDGDTSMGVGETVETFDMADWVKNNNTTVTSVGDAPQVNVAEAKADYDKMHDFLYAQVMQGKSSDVDPITAFQQGIPLGKKTFSKVAPKAGDPKLDGYGEKFFVTDENGTKHLFKVAKEDFRPYTEDAAHQAAELFGYAPAKSAVVKVDGKLGQVQTLIPHEQQVMGGNPLDVNSGDAIKPEDLTVQQLSDIMREHVFDWVVDNDDTHGGNLLIKQDGSVVGIDKGRAWVHFGARKDLSNPQNLSDNTTVYYQHVYQAMMSGKIDKDAMDAAFQAAMSKAHFIADADSEKYRQILEYAFERRPSYSTTVASNKTDLIDAVIARQKAAAQDFDAFWSKVYAGAGYEKPEYVPQLAPGVHTQVDGEFMKSAKAAGFHGHAVMMGSTDFEDAHFKVKYVKTGGQSKAVGSGTLEPGGGAKFEQWIKDNADPKLLNTNNSYTPPDTLTPSPGHIGADKAYNDILGGVKTISHHSADGEYNQAKIDAAKEAAKELNEQLVSYQMNKQYMADTLYKGDLVKTEKHMDMAQQYLNAWNAAEEAMAAKGKAPKFDQYTYVPAPAKAEEPAAPSKYKIKKVSSGYEQGSIDYDNHEFEATGGTYKGIALGQEYEIELPSGAKVRYRPYGEGHRMTHEGQFRFETSGDDAQAVQEIQEFFAHAGLETSNATDQSLELFYWRHMYGHVTGRTDSNSGGPLKVAEHAKNAGVHNWRTQFKDDPAGELLAWREAFSQLRGEKAVNDFVADKGYMPKFKRVALADHENGHGRPYWERFDITDDELYAHGNVLAHSLTDASILDTIMKAGALMATETRNDTLGFDAQGMSSDTDATRGSAEYTFLRQFGGAYNSPQGFQFYFDPKVMKQTQTYSYNGDNFGEKNLKKSYASWGLADSTSKTGGGNETMVKHGPSFMDDLVMVSFASEAQRENTLKYYRDLGIDEIGGVPIEEVFVSYSQADAQLAKVKARLKAKAGK